MSYRRVPFDWESRKQWLEIPFPIEEYHARVAAVRVRKAEAGLDALVVHGAPGWLNGDVRWISNFLTAIGNTVVVLPADGPGR
ncbi:hypothetical protein [Streptomyces sp. NPDC057966]|uniref:hypothetical protein n=1 Tax=Streptomyces sp. NPDC057966 TaxID=3346292 RepID=UPI0036E80D38